MTFYVDTSAIFAILDRGDVNHDRAAEAWKNLLSSEDALATNNYVLVEAWALIQRRLGLPALRSFEDAILPVIEVVWLGAAQHQRAADMVRTSASRDLSLVDCSSFVTMRELGLETAFAFDSHFQQQGFGLIP